MEVKAKLQLSCCLKTDPFETNKLKKSFSKRIQVMKCIACGSTSLIEGELIDTAGGMVSAFKLKDVSTWKSIFGIGIRKVNAYGCVDCSHLQLSVDFNNEDRERYRQYEGKQPGVLERINAESEL
jgi:predicted nucleic-acid-binding Zn-ribbon protein